MTECIVGTDEREGYWYTGEEIVRCRDCEYYDDEPDMESLGEKCWRDPDHTGHSTPTTANGYCMWGKPKER